MIDAIAPRYAELMSRANVATVLYFAMTSFDTEYSEYKDGGEPRSNDDCKIEDHCLAAAELANWLEKQPFLGCRKAENITGENWRDTVSGRTGIICFEDYYTPSGGSGGDHIDLWNGSRMTDLTSGFRTRFGVVIPTIWSDLRKARKIRFFPVY